MTSSPLLDDRDDLALAEIRDAVVENLAAIAAREAANIVELAKAMRIARARMAHQPGSTRDREMHLRSIAAELGVAAHWHDRSVQNRMHAALSLVEDYPATLDALAEGRISAQHAAVIEREGVALTDPAARAIYEEEVLARAESDTVRRTEACARRVAEELNPASISERYAHAIQERRVWMQDLSNGMGELTIIDGITAIRAMHDRLTQQAQAVQAAAAADAASEHAPTTMPSDEPADATTTEPREHHEPTPVIDTRTIDQIRADLVCDLILTGQPGVDAAGHLLPGGLGSIRARVQVTVPALTAAGVSDRGASIDGISPIDADTARALLAGADRMWDRLLTHPITGAVLATDAYRVTVAMDRFLTARDRRCRFPGCRQPARRCEHDHNIDWADGGPTDVCNMALLCKRHHTLKTETPWSARQHPDGTIEWTTPLGHTTRDVPEKYPTVAFVAEPDPPPF